MSACLALMWCRLRVTPFLPGGRRRNPLSTIVYIPGESLDRSGPGSSAVLTVFSFLKVLLGTGRFGVLGAWWAIGGGRSGCGSSSFRQFAIVIISFLFGHVFADALIFSWFQTIVSVCLLY
jgi:hypothetical protein